MDALILPLVESLISSYSGPDFSKVKIIGVQHILETTHAMFRSLYKLGLKPENISMIGKCYSTCQEVYEEMIADGIDVSQASFAYSSHEAFDDCFSREIRLFLSSHMSDLSSGKYERIIVLDDGGKCITILDEFLKDSSFLVAIEQTSSGYEAIRTRTLSFPVINVARSPTKLNIESPMIAKAAAERLDLSLRQRGLVYDRALIIGGGAIGQAMKNQFADKMDIEIYDHDAKYSSLTGNSFREVIGDFRLIIGCTGQTTIPRVLHSSLLPGTTLTSVSSSDREFDAVFLRREIQENQNCHKDLAIRDLLLVNSGFPVNFDGDRENIDPQMIQLTIALITAGILQARELPSKAANSILPVSSAHEAQITDNFYQMTKVPLPLF